MREKGLLRSAMPPAIPFRASFRSPLSTPFSHPSIERILPLFPKPFDAEFVSKSILAG
jgi:hypothetical protein